MLFGSRIQLIILDFDGVIVESNEIKDRVFQKIFSRFPAHCEEFWQFHKTNVSISRYQKFDYVLEKIGRSGDIDFKNGLLTEFSALSLELMRSVPFVKGAKEFLQDMQDHLPLYLASVTPIDDLEIILENLHIHSFFKGVYGCPPWNKPEAIRDVLKKENVLSKSSVLIGDSTGDQKAAQETGIHFIGRDSGLGFEKPFNFPILSNLVGLSSLLKN